MAETYLSKVRRGEKLLDEKWPGWDKKISVEELDIASPCRCVLGQLAGDYVNGKRRLGISFIDCSRAGFGTAFSCRRGVMTRAYKRLTETWKKVILARRAKDPQA